MLCSLLFNSIVTAQASAIRQKSAFICVHLRLNSLKMCAACEDSHGEQRKKTQKRKRMKDRSLPWCDERRHHPRREEVCSLCFLRLFAFFVANPFHENHRHLPTEVF